ncbi:lipoprotein localization factor LolB [Vespertiliibacter pulmonis]|uniref:Outer-membrane lipoprotein LolB n=1 Tax=Vespertiliibacter pulmonis TaxID=1443036 RepID=A0A3N4VSG1_9PAST|nr:lipoprotein insertase outer membrane protein LolB [Vespertiliibacter pulmonis]QLB21539.1 lipoprotein localization factor LolB [Vespertiliibacter pulmonis]RPE85958.1 outer membrane lipoprotein LolB [Vespertiliibacter pulmonis]
MKLITKRLLTLITLITLTGCQSIYDAPEQSNQPTIAISHDDIQWQKHLVQLKQINAYAVAGQFGYISPEERFSSHFDWKYQTPIQFSLTMSSNLSSKSLKLQRHRTGLTISDSEGHSRTEQDINKLMKEIIGISFPIDQFAYWVKGQPEQHSHYIVNEKRQLAQFDYAINGEVWKVNFVEYHEEKQPNLPKLIVLNNGKQTLKIRIDNWTY